MNNSTFLAALFLALPMAAVAQTRPATTPAPKTINLPAIKPVPTTQQTTEVVEDLDPATGKVIRRTTRTTTAPAGTPAAGTGADAVLTRANDAQVSDFFREKTTIATLSTSGLVDTYTRFIDKVRNDRHGWKAADWTMASAVLTSLNGRYDQLRASLTLDDKLSIRSQQAEFQALRTARQLSDQVSDKL